MIGIICALDIEAKQLIENLEGPVSEKIGRLSFTRGVLKGKDVVIGMAGVGKVNAAMCAQTMILKYAPALIVNSGVAGSLSKRLDIGDIAVGTGVVEHDFDTTAVGDPPAFFNELKGLDSFPCDEAAATAILKAAGEEGVHAVKAKIASGDQFISDAGTKARLVQMFGAEACEMEAAAIAHVCFNNGVNCAVIRAISDKADGSAVMDYPAFEAKAAMHSSNLTLGLIGQL